MDQHEDLGPLLSAPPSYLEVRQLLREALGFPWERRPLLIGIDGADGSGKSSLASWLSWQLEMPAVHLDLFLIRDSDPMRWRLDDLTRIIEAQRELGRPLIVEGVQLLYALDTIRRPPDFLIFVEKENHESSMRAEIHSYLVHFLPKDRAQYVLKWTSAEHDERVMRAHHARRE